MAVITLAQRIPSGNQFPLAFNRLTASCLMAQLAEQISLAAAPIVAVIALGAGAGGTGILQAAQTLPFLLLAIPAGILTDRTSRKWLMTGAELLRMLTLAAILILAWRDALTIPLLAALGFLGATGTVAYSIATPSLIPALVDRHQLGRANGRIELIRSGAFVTGPALSGVLVQWVGASPTFAIATMLSAGGALMLMRLAEPRREPAATHHPIADIREGGTFVFGHPLLRPILFTAVFFNIAYFILQAVFVAYAHATLGMNAGEIGVVLSLGGAGMVGGALSSGYVQNRLPLGRVILIGPMMGLAASLVMALTILWPTMFLAGLSFFLIGLGPTIWSISTMTLRQAVTPDRLLGRVSALVTMATWGARPLGAAIGAVIGSQISLPACLLVAVAGFAVQASIITRSEVAHLSVLPAHGD